MGLDMYFEARKSTHNFFGSFDVERGVEDRAHYPENLKVFADYIYEKNFKSVEIIENYQIGYFRKFNALHSYIVNTFADGIDECQEIYLSKENVETLLSVLKEVSEDHDKAPELFTTQSGCFFGSLDYDDYYFTKLEEAIKMFELIINNFDFKEYSLIYQASW